MYVAKTNASIGQAVVHPGSDLAGDESIPSTMDEECPFKVFLARCAPLLPALRCPSCHCSHLVRQISVRFRQQLTPLGHAPHAQEAAPGDRAE